MNHLGFISLKPLDKPRIHVAMHRIITLRNDNEGNVYFCEVTVEGGIILRVEESAWCIRNAIHGRIASAMPLR